MMSGVQAQTKEKPEDGNTKGLAQDVEQLKDLFKNKVVVVEVPVGNQQRSYHGRIVGVRQILGERFLELRPPLEGGFAGDTITLVNWKSIVVIRQE